jgi:hypothetical protein
VRDADSGNELRRKKKKKRVKNNGVDNAPIGRVGRVNGRRGGEFLRPGKIK